MMTEELMEKIISALEGMQTALTCIAGALLAIGIILAIFFSLKLSKER